jgi:hypothetical protein
MSLFVEVNSVEKGCPVIINLEHIVEIAPLASGGCALFMIDGAGMNSKTGMRVSDSYNLFKQFAMQTVSADDIARRFPKVKADAAPAEKPQPEQKQKSKSKQEFDIPKFGE